MAVQPNAAPWLVGVGAGLVFLVALLSPVEMVDSDPAIALLASQALLDHGTLSLDVYRDDPSCAYDFDTDYRVKKVRGSSYYFSFGHPILAAPAVWIANRMGFHMLRQADEFAVQNFLSALACGLIFLLLYALCRHYLEPLPSFLVAAISTLGSSLMSTLATGLWNTDLAVVLIGLALLHLAGRGDRAANAGYLAVLLVPAFLCRPSSAIFAFALLVSRLRYSRRNLIGLAVAVVSGMGLWLILHLFGGPEWLPAYYFDRRLAPESFFVGIFGLLASPSRGLLVFSPFLLPVLVAFLVERGRLRESPMLRLVVIWVPLLLAALALKSMWWGGHSYGSRVTAELMPGFALLTALLWRGRSWRGGAARPRLAVAAYLLLAIPAIAINSGQGLFNPAVRRWNEQPNIDRYPGTLFDWRSPQFLASDELIEERRLRLEPPILVPYRLGESLSYEREGVVFVGWYAAEEGLRWTQGRSAEVRIAIEEVDPAGAHLVQIEAGSLGRQQFELSVNDSPVAEFELGEVASRPVVFLLAPGVLRRGENRLQLSIRRPIGADGDPRELGLALRGLRIDALPSDPPTIDFRQGEYLTEGFSEAEEGWRWTAAKRAAIAYPVGAVDQDAAYSLRLTAGALGDQTIHLRINGHRLGSLELAGFEPTVVTVPVPAAVLRPFEMQRLELELPGATRTAADIRLLGMAFVDLRLAEVRAQPDAVDQMSP